MFHYRGPRLGQFIKTSKWPPDGYLHHTDSFIQIYGAVFECTLFLHITLCAFWVLFITKIEQKHNDICTKIYAFLFLLILFVVAQTIIICDTIMRVNTNKRFNEFQLNSIEFQRHKIFLKSAIGT